MSREMVASLIGQVLTQASVTGTRPSAAGDGVDCSSWFRGGYGPARISIFFDADAARTLADATGGAGGVEVWGWSTKLGQWYLAAYLNNGTDIPIAADTQGYVETIDLGRAFDRLAIAGVPSGGTVSAKFVPLDVDRG